MRVYAAGQQPQHRNGQRDRKEEGTHVARRLTDLYAGQAEENRQDERERDEEQPLPGCRNNACAHGHGDVLQQHVAHGRPRDEREGDALPAHGRRADADDLGVVRAENGDDLRCEDPAHDREQQERNGRHLDAEPEATADAVILACAEIEAAHGLETLPEADHRGACELRHAGDDAHCGNGRVAIGTGSGVQAGDRNGRQTLTAQAGQAATCERRIPRAAG